MSDLLGYREAPPSSTTKLLDYRVYSVGRSSDFEAETAEQAALMWADHWHIVQEEQVQVSRLEGYRQFDFEDFQVKPIYVVNKVERYTSK